MIARWPPPSPAPHRQDPQSVTAVLDTHKLEPDLADPVDQLMVVRHHDDRLYLPQRPEIAAAMLPSDQSGRWYLLLADHPWQAFACVRAKVNRDPSHRATCGCRTQLLAHGPWSTIRARVAQLRPDLVVPQLPPDVCIVD